MKSKQQLYQELDGIVLEGIKNKNADLNVLFWEGKALVDELFRGYRENLLMNFCMAALAWPNAQNRLSPNLFPKEEEDIEYGEV